MQFHLLRHGALRVLYLVSSRLRGQRKLPAASRTKKWRHHRIDQHYLRLQGQVTLARDTTRHTQAQQAHCPSGVRESESTCTIQIMLRTDIIALDSIYHRQNMCPPRPLPAHFHPADGRCLGDQGSIPLPLCNPLLLVEYFA